MNEKEVLVNPCGFGKSYRYLYTNIWKETMTMDDLIFEMGQPNEIVTCSEWTEWWAVDETGLHLEYAPGYAPCEMETNYETETCMDNTESIYIDVDFAYDNKMKYLQERYEEVFGNLDDNFTNNMYMENDIDLFAEKQTTTPFPITQSSIDYDKWPSDYLEHLRDIIDHYNGPDAEWRQELSNLRAEEPESDPEERVVEVPSTDGLILPS